MKLKVALMEEASDFIKEQFKLTPADVMKDKLWGKIGTPERDKMEAQQKEDVHAYFIRQAITSPH